MWGLSIATLLARHNDVTAAPVVRERVDMVNNKESPIRYDCIGDHLANKPLRLHATLDGETGGYADKDFAVIAAPTSCDTQRDFFDTSAVEAVAGAVPGVNPEAVMVMGGAIPGRLYPQPLG